MKQETRKAINKTRTSRAVTSSSFEWSSCKYKVEITVSRKRYTNEESDDYFLDLYDVITLDKSIDFRLNIEI